MLLEAGIVKVLCTIGAGSSLGFGYGLVKKVRKEFSGVGRKVRRSAYQTALKVVVAVAERLEPMGGEGFDGGPAGVVAVTPESGSIPEPSSLGGP